jgi:hypothetical protein
MRPDHYLCLALTPAVQAILLFAAVPNSRGSATSYPFVILALVVPLACYVWGLRDAPIAPQTSRRAVRFALLGLVAVGLSLGGFIFGLEAITAHAASQ